MPQSAPSCPGSVLHAASQLMAEVGYGAMSMRQLAARVGMQPGSLYHHVTSKQDLLLDVLLDIYAQRLDAWRCSTYSRDLQGFLLFLLERQRSHPAEALLLRHEARHIDPAQRGWLQEARQRQYEPLRHYIIGDLPRTSLAVDEVQGLGEAVLGILEAASTLRQQAPPMDEADIEAWVMRMSRRLIGKAGAPALVKR